jgi:hypothetical protein
VAIGRPSRLPNRGEIAGDVDLLGLDPHLAPEPHAIALDPAVVDRPEHLPNQGPALAEDLVDGRLQGALRLFQRLSVLSREGDQGHRLSLLSWGRSQQRHVNTQKITHIMVHHTMKRPNTTVM